MTIDRRFPDDLALAHGLALGVPLVAMATALVAE